jgi:hypothetical protein
MTSEEIKKANARLDFTSEGQNDVSVVRWMQEIAYQLAVMNERQIPAPITLQDWEFGGFMKGQNK